MKNFYILALVAAMFAACATDVTEDVAIEAPETLKVSFEESSRIQLDDNKTVWTKGDLVSVFYKSYENMQWQFEGETGDKSGTLKCIKGNIGEQTMDNVVIAYPYSDKYALSLTTGGLDAVLPAEQSYMYNSFGLDASLMVANSEFTQFTLKNVLGWLMVQLKGDGQIVEKITLKGNNNEQVAGLIHIDTTTATATLASNGSNEDNYDEVSGTLVFDNVIIKEVTLNCNEYVKLDSYTTSFYIALPPQTFTNGLTIEVTCNDGTTMTKSTDKAITIERNTIQPMAVLEYEGALPEVFELAYTTNDGEPLDPLTTEGFGAKFVENIFDPATGKGALKFDGRVTTIPEKAFLTCTNLTHINLPLGITSIELEAFSGCKAIEVMDIPQGVTKIGYGAFLNCSGMIEITIPSSVTSATVSFIGCGGKANINCEIDDQYFHSAKFTEVVIDDSVTWIGDYAFYDCTSLTSVIIGDSVTSIGSEAFYNCTSLTSITIPNSVTSIGSAAFENCTSLTSVTIPNGVTEIRGSAFADCSSLSSITIPDSVTEIGNYAFEYCTSLKEVYYNGNLSAWCKIDFDGYNANPMCHGAKLYLNGIELTEVTIPSEMTEIKDCTFSGCTSLTSVTIHNRVSQIGSSAFCGCTSLTSVTIGKRVTSIGDYAFKGCTSLTNIIIPENVNYIGRGAFFNCTSLTSVTIPDSVTSIRDEAFENCTSLKEVYYTGDLSAWCKIGFIDSYSNPMYNGAKLYLNGVELTEVTFPSDITTIKNYLFIGCTSLTSVTIGDSVTEIGLGAFANCSSLTSVIIHDSVTEIGYYAFYNCTSLTSVTIPDSVTSIGDYAFGDCTSLKEVYCKPTTPPSGDYGMFGYNASGLKIYVPRASVDAYKAASGWSYYESYIEPYDFE